MIHPKTDILCLVYNQLETTRLFVEYLFNNTQNFQLIFVNNGSNDETTEYLEQGRLNNKWKVVSSSTNLGVIGGRNLGVREVTAEYFLNIDNDQYVKAGWLEILHGKIKEGYDIVGKEAWALVPPGKGGVVVINGSPKISDRTYFPYKRCTKPTDEWTYIGCGGMLIKTEVYNKIGLFDEIFSPAYFEDPDLCFRAIKAGYKLGWCPTCPIDHVGHQTFNNQSLFEKNAQFQQSWSRFKTKWKDFYPRKGEKNESKTHV